MQSLQRLAVATALAALTGIALAADFDGSKPFLCAAGEAHDCAPGEACERSVPQDLNLPPFVKIDFAGHTISARGRVSTIQSTTRVDDMLVVQGVDNGRAFSLAVTPSTGEFVGAIAGGGEAFVVFGSCTML